MAGGVSGKTRNLVMGALLSAMGVALLFVGSAIEVLDLSMAAIASFLCIFAVIEMNRAYPYLIYAVTAVLSVFLMPYNMGAWIYALFFGYYPIIKEKLERLKKPVAWVLKLVVLNVAVTVYAVICYFMFFGEISAMMDEFAAMIGAGVPQINITVVFFVAIYLIVNVTFVIYDIALTRLITLYLVKLRRKFKFLNRS